MHFPRVISFRYGGKPMQLLITVAAFTFLLSMLRLCTPRQKAPSIYDYTEGRTSPWRDWKNNTAAARSDEIMFLSELIEKYGLTREVPWYSRRMQTSFASGKRPSIADVRSKFMAKDFTRARIDDDSLELRTQKGLKLSVPRSPTPDQIDAGALLFGIATTYTRLTYANNTLLRDWERWLTDGKGNSNGASLVLALHKTNEVELRKVESALLSAGIDAMVVQSERNGDATSRYLELIQTVTDRAKSLAQEGKTKSYLAIADDDIFFPSMDKLLHRLSKFSPRKEYYIGAPSERSDWIVEHDESLTYGGAAVFLTLPMVDALSQLPCLEQRKRNDGSTFRAQWDVLLYECITSHTDTKLQVLPSYYDPEVEALYDRQLDTEGYAGGSQPLTLHHYQSSHRFNAGKAHLVTAVCGEDCFLQRFRFRDDWILVNGLAISHYPDGVDALPLRPPEKPKKQSKLVAQNRVASKSSDHKPPSERIVIDGTDRPGKGDVKVVAWRGRKRTWRLLEARLTDSGEVWQAYVKRRGGGNAADEIDDRLPGDIIHSEEEVSDTDSVIVLIWEP